ncbi:hypothetical protein C9374_000809 [Naegleria lovaniensis]|uniref:Uncharacterized protein n=1 Tax=Naegleria lovaniensis TaxID=51637 RepID=A0AA88GXK4_NAELO|nr:uncharacterized protein C9374_000809 [Naegleria lovaniensis]KAG2387959.1 hypothetical protein C9374_000809 [Naegleria lovaniensis]
MVVEGWIDTLINTITERLTLSSSTTKEDASTIEEVEKEWEGIGEDQYKRAQQFLNSIGVVISGPLLKEMMKQKLEDRIYYNEIGACFSIDMNGNKEGKPLNLLLLCPLYISCGGVCYETRDLLPFLNIEIVNEERKRERFFVCSPFQQMSYETECCDEESIAEYLIENIIYKNPIETSDVGQHWLVVSLKTPNGGYLTSKKYRINISYDNPMLTGKYGSIWNKIMRVLMALRNIEDRSLHLKVWYFFASIENATCISEWEKLSRLHMLNADRSVYVELTRQYFESIELGESPYFLLTQSKIFCIIFAMYSQDDTSLFPFSQELKILFQSYFDKFIKKYQCLTRIVSIFKISISIIEKDELLRKEIEKNKVRMLLTIKNDVMGELSRLCSELSYKIRPMIIADFLKCVFTVCQEAECLLTQI